MGSVLVEPPKRGNSRRRTVFLFSSQDVLLVVNRKRGDSGGYCVCSHCKILIGGGMSDLLVSLGRGEKQRID